MLSKAQRLLFPCLIIVALAYPSGTGAQGPPPGQPNQQQLSKLADRMCGQLPNLALLPFKDDRFSGDDVHDTLVMLGARAVPCLGDRITDETWMPDPRQAPIADVRAGDIAFFILNELGVDFDVVLPMLDKEKWDGVGIYAYFAWANQLGNRKRPQEAVRQWLRNHPDCCRREPSPSRDSRIQPRFRLSSPELSQLQQKLARLQPGMEQATIPKMLGPADFMHDEKSPGFNLGMHMRKEASAAFYFVERWSEPRAARDFLCDRYVILFFSDQGKFIRMFSNVEEIPPIFPASKDVWFRLAWPDMEP
jgi:hypothetical protein